MGKNAWGNNYLQCDKLQKKVMILSCTFFSWIFSEFSEMQFCLKYVSA